MSENINGMLYVKELPWNGLGHSLKDDLSTSHDIVKSADMDWTVNYTDVLSSNETIGQIPGFFAIYREDKNSVLGLVKSSKTPVIVQNENTFSAFEPLLNHSDIIPDTASSLNGGEKIFGCFKINDKYKVLDDDVEHYFVVLNEHLKPDGKITILNTPIRVVCQNTLTAALSNYNYKIRVAISEDPEINTNIAQRIIASAGSAIDELNKNAEKMVSIKLKDDSLNYVMDELFPYIKADASDSEHVRANEKTDILRQTFEEKCFHADNLANYEGTVYQMFQAMSDFSGHFYKKSDNVVDINYRMNTLQGMGGYNENSSILTKYMKIQKKLMAA